MIAFTPPRGLPYPRVYPRCTHLPARRLYLAVNAASTYLPSLPSSFAAALTLSPSPLTPVLPLAAITFLLPHHDLHHRTFRLHSMQYRSRYLLRTTTPSLSLSLRLFTKLRRGIIPPFSAEQTTTPLYKRAHRRRRSVRDLGDEGMRREERARDRETGREKKGENKRREGERRITGIICPPARATISPDPPAISRSSSASLFSRRGCLVRRPRRRRTSFTMARQR